MQSSDALVLADDLFILSGDARDRTAAEQPDVLLVIDASEGLPGRPQPPAEIDRAAQHHGIGIGDRPGVARLAAADAPVRGQKSAQTCRHAVRDLGGGAVTTGGSDDHGAPDVRWGHG